MQAASRVHFICLSLALTYIGVDLSVECPLQATANDYLAGNITLSVAVVSSLAQQEQLVCTLKRCSSLLCRARVGYRTAPFMRTRSSRGSAALLASLLLPCFLAPSLLPS